MHRDQFGSPNGHLPHLLDWIMLAGSVAIVAWLALPR